MNSMNIAALETKVQAVAEQTAELADAITEERAERTAMMALVLHTIKPALSGVLANIRTSRLYDNNDMGRDRTTYHARQGLRLDGVKLEGKTGPVCDDGDRGGALEGWDTFLLGDGSLLELHYSGSWSCYDCDTTTWEVSEETIVPAEEAAAYLVGESSDEAALQAISAALDQQLEGKTRAQIKEARERADWIRAVVKLAS